MAIIIFMIAKTFNQLLYILMTQKCTKNIKMKLVSNNTVITAVFIVY